jgi:hypothetical protein
MEESLGTSRVNQTDWEIMTSVPMRYNETHYETESYNPYANLQDNPFWPTLSFEAGQLAVAFAKGYVVVRFVRKLSENGGDSIGYLEPINTNFPIPMNVGDKAYVQLNTDMKGEPTNLPEIVIMEAGNNPTGQRFYPQVGDYEGANGVFFYYLGEVAENDGAYEFNRFHAGDNIHHIIERVSMVNLPVVPPESTPPENIWNVLKNYFPEDDEIRYRSLKQLDVVGEPIINPLYGSETKQEKETIDFRRIAERETGLAQIKVKGREAGIIHIEGNNKSGRLVKTTTTPSESGSGTPTVTEQVLLEWDDGLVTTEGDVFFEVGTGGGGCVDGGTGTLETIEEGASTGTSLLTWENGCVKTNGSVTLQVVELEVCIDGTPTLKKFLTLPEPPPTP